jgi:putative peptidoglycan lipid II flippase
MVKVKGENIQRATAFVMLTLLFSRLLGFVREVIVAKVYGSSIVTDAFFSAFTIPDVMFNLLVAGGLSSGFMPVFTSYLANDDEEGAWKAASTFITVALIFIVIFNILGIAFAKYLVPLVAIGNIRTPEGYELTVKLTRIMFSAVTFTVLAGLLRGILNSYKIFTSPSIGPMLYNVGMILGALLLGKTFGIYGMAVGVIVGAFFNFVVQYPDFRRVGGRFKLNLDLENPGFRKMLRLMGPAIIGLSVSQINLVINQNIASLLGPGSITLLRYANRVMILPLGIFAMGIATTMFPLINAYFAKKEIGQFKDTLSQSLRTVMFLTIPAAVGMTVLNVPIVRLLFRTGKFTEQDVIITAFILAFYSLGLVGQSGIQILTRGFYAVQDTKTPVKFAAVALVLNAVLNLIFVSFGSFGSLAIGGIAFSYSITSIINMIMLYKSLSKKMEGLRTKSTIVSITKSTLASIVMGGGAFIVSRVIESKLGTASKFAQLIDVGLAMTVGILLYFGTAYLLKMTEMEYVTNKIKKRIKK